MFQVFAAYLLRNRVNAILMAIIFSILPYFSWVTCVIVALVTWRKRPAEGFIVMMWASLPAVVGGVVTGLWIQLAIALYSLGLVFAAAVFFRRYPSWSILIQTMSLWACLLVLAVHAFVPNIAGWWQQMAGEYMARMQQVFGQYLVKSDVDNLGLLSAWTAGLSRVMTGLALMWVTVSTWISLFIARSLSRSLPEWPMFMKQEDSQLTMSWMLSLLLIGVVMWAYFGPRWPVDFLPVLWMPFVVSGLALLNFFLVRKKAIRKFVVFIYLALWIAITIWWPLILVFGVAGIVDSVVHVRSRVSHKRS